MAMHSKELNDERRKRKMEQSQQHISQIGWEMFELHGYEQVTMEAISNASDVAKATLYKYFPCKEALLEYRFRSEMSARKDEIQAGLFQHNTLRARLAYLFQVEADYLQNKRHYLGALLSYRMRTTSIDQNPAARSQFFRALIMIISEAQTKGEIKAIPSAEVLATYLNFLRSADLFYWISHLDSSLPELHHKMLDLFLHGAANSSIK